MEAISMNYELRGKLNEDFSVLQGIRAIKDKIRNQPEIRIGCYGNHTMERFYYRVHLIGEKDDIVREASRLISSIGTPHSFNSDCYVGNYHCYCNFSLVDELLRNHRKRLKKSFLWFLAGFEERRVVDIK
jgi:hypothetical protein